MDTGLVRHCFIQGDFIEGVFARCTSPRTTLPVWRSAANRGGHNEASEYSRRCCVPDPWAGAKHPWPVWNVRLLHAMKEK